MDSPDFPTGKSPRRELQGPRPAPLKVSKESHKIKKPPVAPPSRQPVIIYTVSPKVIHANPSEFMSLVQRLTGPSSSITSSSTPFFQDNSGAVSPAARFASIEKTKLPEGKKTQMTSDDDVGIVEGMEFISSKVERTSFLPSILSPNPSSLPPIPPNFFSPSFDPNPLSFFHDLSPVLQTRNRNFLDASSFMPSPSNFLSPHLTSPTQPLDLFNNFFEF